MEEEDGGHCSRGCSESTKVHTARGKIVSTFRCACAAGWEGAHCEKGVECDRQIPVPANLAHGVWDVAGGYQYPSTATLRAMQQGQMGRAVYHSYNVAAFRNGLDFWAVVAG